MMDLIPYIITRIYYLRYVLFPYDLALITTTLLVRTLRIWQIKVIGLEWYSRKRGIDKMMNYTYFCLMYIESLSNPLTIL